MEDILRIYTIQWVGPFSNYAEMKEHYKVKKQQEGQCSHPGLFSFYYFSGNKKWKRDKKFAYFGKHEKIDSIFKRLNPRHEHYSRYHENENLQIWIGTLANPVHQEEEIIDFIETVFINRYKDDLSDNIKKKAKPFIDAVTESFVIVNLWYDTSERPFKTRTSFPFDDVIVYEVESERILKGKLKVEKLPLNERI